MSSSVVQKPSEVAREIAYRAHADQKYGTKSYIYHLAQVVDIVRDFGFNDEGIVAAAWLHDLLEDQPKFGDDLHFSGLPQNTVDIVVAVTDESGKNRKERKAKTYSKIRACFGAQVVKLADRIANVRESKENNPELLRMYQKEHSEFRAGVYTNNVRLFPMQEELDCLLA